MFRLLPAGGHRHARRTALFLSTLVIAVATASLITGSATGRTEGASGGTGGIATLEGAPGPVTTRAVKHDTSRALRALPPVRPGRTGRSQIPLHIVPHGVVPQGHGKLSDTPTTGSTAVQQGTTSSVATMPAFDQNFEGVGNVNYAVPPDTQGDVGPDNYVQMVNLSFAVWDKQGNLLYGPVANTTLWQDFGGPCETVNGGDPITMYDEQANRWFMSQLAFPQLTNGSGGYHECIAISKTPDPLGAWYRYDFKFSDTTLNDYPKFGVWPDAYYASVNEFEDAYAFTGVTVQAYERDRMLRGQDARVVSFHTGDSSGIYGSLLPSDAEGGALGHNPPPGAPNPFVTFDEDAWGFSPTDRILMWDFHVDWSSPSDSTFGVGSDHAPNRFFETAPFDSNLCNYSRGCIPQPGTPFGLDAVSDRMMQRAAYRNFGDHQGIALTHTVKEQVNGENHAGIRWYQLDHDGAGWSLRDQGTFAPDSDNRWMGSAALDASGDLAVGYSVSSTSTYPSIRVAGRLAGDPAGELAQGESTLIAGGGSQAGGSGRWGDYSSMQVDPTDGCTFWYTNEYLHRTSQTDWRTRIGSFKFPGCTAGPHGTLTGTVTDAGDHTPIADAAVSTSVAGTITDGQGHYTFKLVPGTYDVTFAAFGHTTATESNVRITDGQTTTLDKALDPVPSVHLHGRVSDGSGHGWPLYTRIDVAGRSRPVFTDPVTGRYDVQLPANATYSLKYTAMLPGYDVVRDSVDVGSGDVGHDVQIALTPDCTAPGYSRDYALKEPFDGDSIPSGWTVRDDVGEGHQWQINDPTLAPNLTGGKGNFAGINSGFYGIGDHQDTSLVTPVLDLSQATSPVLDFHNNYDAFFFFFFPQTGDVELSTDGGQSWTSIWHHAGDSVPGPDLESIPIPQAAGESAVQVRFRFTATWGFSWMVDDVEVVTDQVCNPVRGGLVVGNVFDSNTNDPLNGANISSDAKSSESGTTASTPDDRDNPDGYYWLFSSLSGRQSFTANTAPAPYQPATQTVNVAADDVTRADFTLSAGRLVIGQTAISQSLVLGKTGTSTLHLENTGVAPATVKLSEREGAYQILRSQGAPLRRITFGDGRKASPGFLGKVQRLDGPGIYAGAPSDPTWSTTASYPLDIIDNGAAFLGGKVYSVGGVDATASDLTNKGYVYSPDDNAWTPIAPMPIARAKPSVAAVDGKLYVTGGWNGYGNLVAQTDVYDPATDSWSTVSPNPHPTAAPGIAVADGKIYLVGGCPDAACWFASPRAVRYDPASNTWDSIAAYPHGAAWEACGGIGGTVYCSGGNNGGITYKNGFAYDPGANSWSRIADMPIDLWQAAYGAPNGLFVVSSGITDGFSTVTNQGFAYDPSTNDWSPLPNAQFPRYRSAGSCGFYKIGGASFLGFGGGDGTRDVEVLSGLNHCGATDLPWLSESPAQLTLAPGASIDVTLTLKATADAGVTQPGTYTAQILAISNTPYRVDPINVTMTVTAPKGWGKITGTATGTDCHRNTNPHSAIVFADGQRKNGFSWAAQTDANGYYSFWAPADTYTLIVTSDGWRPETTTAKITGGKTKTVDFNLRPYPSC